MLTYSRLLIFTLAITLLLMSLGCAPGNERWDQEINPGNQAGFWAGIWHGLIIVVTFIISLFTKEVGVYEINNNGWPYNLGFLIGLCFSVAAPWRWGIFRRKHVKLSKCDYQKIGDQVEERVRAGLKDWLDEEKKKEAKEKEWDEIATKIEEKIKKSLKNWAEKD